MSGLADAYSALGRRDEALSLWQELIDIQVSAAEQPEAEPATLNNVAWLLLTHEIEELRDPPRALDLARRACEAEETADGESLWMFLDTLALAQRRTGDISMAIATQKRAISLHPNAGDPAATEHMLKQLVEFETALAGKQNENVDAATANDDKRGEFDAPPAAESTDKPDEAGKAPTESDSREASQPTELDKPDKVQWPKLSSDYLLRIESWLRKREFLVA